MAPRRIRRSQAAACDLTVTWCNRRRQSLERRVGCYCHSSNPVYIHDPMLTNPGQKTTGQKTTKMVFLWRNLKSPDYVFLFHCIRQWAKKMTLFVAVRLL